VILSVSNSLSEMVTFMPITSPFVRFAGRFVDDSFGVAAGWNFFIFVRSLPLSLGETAEDSYYLLH
jgi:amino acid transporter